MTSNKKWITIRIPQNLKREFEETKNSFANFAQFAQYALRKELERLDG